MNHRKLLRHAEAIPARVEPVPYLVRVPEDVSAGPRNSTSIIEHKSKSKSNNFARRWRNGSSVDSMYHSFSCSSLSWDSDIQPWEPMKNRETRSTVLFARFWPAHHQTLTPLSLLLSLFSMSDTARSQPIIILALSSSLCVSTMRT
jgi:hypothetical protein